MVRLSGPESAHIAGALTDKPLPPPRQAGLRAVIGNDREVIDQALIITFPGPASFTGEEVVEIHAHGSPVVLEMIVAAAIAHGARRAQPGEFSQRAFLNNRIDLAQAEAIADLIDASSRRAARAAMRSLEGEFSRQVETLGERIIDLRVYVEAALDFPDEDIDFLADGQVLQRAGELADQIEQLLSRAARGRLLSHGLKIAIVGRPNAGKSSLFNALARRQSAIVTPVPGTTRDVLRETVMIAGIHAELADTAGLRATDDPIEREGVRRAESELASADIVLWVVDDNDPNAATAPCTEAPLIRVDNKIDISGRAPGRYGDRVAISARTGAGLDALDRQVGELVGLDAADESEFSARQRHIEALSRAGEHVRAGMHEIAHSGSGELLAEELRAAADELGSITGKISADELLGRIFSAFCIGK